MTEPFRVVIADPPWKLGDSLPGKTRGAAKQYHCLSLSEIMRFPLPPIADKEILFLWRLSAMPQEALDVIKVWGFRYKSEIVWEKLTKTEKPHMGSFAIVGGTMGGQDRFNNQKKMLCGRLRSMPRRQGLSHETR